MPLDGITINCLKDELKGLCGAKINKISQPKSLDLIINLYKKENLKLYITANASNPRIHLTSESPENPLVPPNFCMVLRKHLQNGTIQSIDQFGLDRVLKINISSYDEMGYSVTKSLVVEIMGRHSNVILIDEDNKIIDAMTKVNSKMSRVREILPGMTYAPLEDDKIDLINEDKNPSQSFDRESKGQFYKNFYLTYTGMSPAISKELCYRADIDPTIPTDQLSDDDFHKINKEFEIFANKLRTKDFRPCIIFSKEDNKPKDFYCMDLNYLDGNIKHYDSINTVLAGYYKLVGSADKLKSKSSNLHHTVEDSMSHLNKKIEDRKIGLKDAKDRDKYRVYGDLLSANFHKLEGGEEKIRVKNFYTEDLDEIEIDLDQSKSGPQNAQDFYKKYSKLKNREKIFKKDLAYLQDELEYLEQIKLSFKNISSLDELEEIEDELIKSSYIKEKQKNKRGKKDKAVSQPMKYLSTDGQTIYVGKNNTQNDHITLKIANKDDYFFHVQAYPGSHVILKTDNNTSHRSIIEAAYLAAYYSSVSDANLVTVDFTEKKNVYKAKGAKPGMVYYNDHESIVVDMRDSQLKDILKRKEG